MRQLEQVMREVITWLVANRSRYALIGGLAVSFRTIERFTKDIDLVIAVENAQQAETCVRELAGLGFQKLHSHTCEQNATSIYQS